MINLDDVYPPTGTYTPEQQQMRDCLAAALADQDYPSTVRIATELIEVIRDELLAAAAAARRFAALAAINGGLKTAELVAASGQSKQTINRLLAEARQEVRDAA